MSTQTVEQIKGLLESGSGLLKRLLQFKTTMKDPKLRPNTFEKQLEKVVSKLTAKFPDVVPTEKISGFDMLTSNAKQVLGELSSSYFALVDSYDWVKKVKAQLAAMADKLAVLSLKETPSTMSLFLTLVQQFGQVCIFIGQLPSHEKRVTLIVYSRMHYYQTKSEEPLFKETAQWIAGMDDPFPFIAESLAPCSKHIAQCLRDLSLTIADISDSNKLRQDSVLNVLGKANEIQVITDDLLRFELTNAERVRIWTFYAAVACPNVLREDDTIFASTLGVLINENMVAHIEGSEAWTLHDTLERLWDSAKTKDKRVSKNTSKEKRAIREGLHRSVTTGWDAHTQRRIFLSQELHDLVAIAKDTPAIIPFKLNLMIAALAMAREEIFWYFRHLTYGPTLYPKKENWKDPRITELMYYQRTLEDTIFMQSENISRFFAQLLVVADAKAAAEAARELSAVAGDAPAIANEMAGILAGFGGDPEAVFDNDFELCEKVHELYDALDYAMTCLPDASNYGSALVTMHAIARHAEYIYALDTVLDRNSSLLNLWYYDNVVRDAYNRHLSGERLMVGAPHCAIYLLLLMDFPRTTNEYWPEEREYIGQKCVEEAESFCKALASRVQDHMKTILSFSQTHVNQLSAMHALSIYQTSLESFKPPKDFQPPTKPGTESQFENRSKLRDLRFALRDMSQIVHSLSQLDEVVVFDTRFVPLEYIREVIQNVFRNWLHHMMRPNKQGSLRRPSDILRRFEVVLHALASVEHFATLGLEAAWREVLLSEFFLPNFSHFGSSEATPLNEVDMNETTVCGLLSWYDNFISKTVPNSGGNIIYSPIRRTFVTRPDAPPQLALPMAESMMSVTELRALVSIMGPYGVKVFDASLLRRVATLTASMKEQLTVNAAILEEISQSYSVESRFIDAAKKLKEMDRFVTNAVQIGVLLTFRSMLKEALHDVSQDTTPYIASAIETTFNCYPRNVHPEAGLLALDLFASDYGVDVGVADQSLKAVLKTAMADGDQKTWRLLPVMFGVMFLSPIWRESHFIPSLDAYQNNLHLLCRVINDYILGFASLIIYPPDDKQVIPFLTQFVEIASMTLLRQTRIPVKGDKKPDWPAITIFIDQFVASCPLISHDVLEQSIPYALIRSLTKEIYGSRQADGW